MSIPIINFNILSVTKKFLTPSTLFLFFLLAFQSQAAVNQPPIARLSTTSPQVVSVGTDISLDATGSSDPDSQFLTYSWSLVKKPNDSFAYLTTPSPSQPSFQVDVVGFYVVQLIVIDIFNMQSEPQFLVFSAVATSEELTDNNSIPVTSDLFLETSITSNSVSGTLIISDSDVGQSHNTELLNFSDMRGFATLMLDQFSYTSSPGFKGLDVAYVLTYDDGTPSKGVVSKISVNVNYNTAPKLRPHHFFKISKNSSSSLVTLLPGNDLELDPLTYSLVDSPSQGTLSNCLGGTSILSCRYTPPTDFTGNVTFSYKANDGSIDSSISTVTLKILSFSEAITQIVSGYNHTCAIFSEGHIRCWGANKSKSLGLGHDHHIGDNEIPFFYGDVNVGEKVLKTRIGGTFYLCSLRKPRHQVLGR